MFRAPPRRVAGGPGAVRRVSGPRLSRVSEPATAAFVQLTADFVGAEPAHLRDGALLSGLLVAAAGAAGLTAVGAPIVHDFPGHSVGELLLLDGCRVSAHAFPDRELLLVDIVALATHDVRKALDVFKRRVPAREVRSEQRPRG